MNYVALIGRLTKDPEIKDFSTGKRNVRITLAVQRYGDQVDFINCVAWEKTAELIAQYTKKGQRIAVQGNLNVRSYQTQNGETRWSTDVIVDRVEFLESSSNSNSNYSSDESFNSSKSASKPFMEEDDSYDEEDFPF